MMQEFEQWVKDFDSEWESLQHAQSFQARISQQEVTRLQSKLHFTRQQLKSAKESAAALAKRKKKDEALASGDKNGLRLVELNNSRTFRELGLMLLGEGLDEEVDDGCEEVRAQQDRRAADRIQAPNASRLCCAGDGRTNTGPRHSLPHDKPEAAGALLEFSCICDSECAPSPGALPLNSAVILWETRALTCCLIVCA